MKQVKLGSQGAKVSRMGLGCMGMNEFYGDRNDAESSAAILSMRVALTRQSSDPAGKYLLKNQAINGHRLKSFIARAA